MIMTQQPHSASAPDYAALSCSIDSLGDGIRKQEVIRGAQALHNIA
jgi:hypothetical protein